MIDIFHPDYQLRKLDEALERSREEWKSFTPEERLQYCQRQGWVDENGMVTPAIALLRDINF